MHKATLFFSVLSLVLVAAISFTLHQIFTADASRTEPSVAGASDLFGLPGLRRKTDTQLFQATSAVVYDREQQSIIFEQNGFQRVPIASLTKLMTAMVALEYGIDWDAPVAIQPNEYVIGGQLRLFSGEQVTMRDLFYASLLGSANNATLAYVRQLGVPEDEFVRAMNRKAIELGLEQTTFVEVTGLDDNNVSTAYEVAKLAAAAFNLYPEIRAATTTPAYSFTVIGNGRQHTIANTNKNVTPDAQPYTGTKTGYLYESGYCLVVQGKNQSEMRIAVLLGSAGEQLHFIDIDRLLNTI